MYSTSVRLQVHSELNEVKATITLMKTVFTSSKKEARSNAILTVEQSGHVELFKRFQVDKHLNISDELSSNSYSLAQLNSNQSAGQWEALFIFLFKRPATLPSLLFPCAAGNPDFLLFPTVTFQHRIPPPPLLHFH